MQQQNFDHRDRPAHPLLIWSSKKTRPVGKTRGAAARMEPWPSETAYRRVQQRAQQQKLRKRGGFDAADYASGDGMQTAIFGPVFWTAIHLVSFNYPTEPTARQKHDYKTWLLATGAVLPCKYCRDNFQKNFEAAWTSNAMDGRESFSRFCYRLHDEVNRMLGKSSNHTYEEVRDIYEGFRSRCLTQTEKEAFARSQKEAGCVHERYAGTKGKCVLHVVPRTTACESLQISSACQVKKKT